MRTFPTGLIAALIATVGVAVADNAGVTSQRLTLNPIRLAAGGAPGGAASLGAAADAATGRASQPERYSGYFKLNHTSDAHMFFFLFEAREDPDNAPVVLWMTGGPGCSSELAVFYENGPWSINADLSLRETEYGWDRAAHMIFVDQPINTGFSYSSDEADRCYDEQCVGNDMLDFLQALFAARPSLAGRDVFITGESYAGHYVPAVAARVFHAAAAGEADIKLRGLAIGNGLTDPAIQYGAYADFALQEGLISQSTRDEIQFLYPACRLALQVCDGLDWSVECELAVEFCTATMFAPVLALNPGINVYDLRKECTGPLCYDFSRMERYLAQPAVRKALGVGDRTWEACSESVHADMMADWGHSFDGVLPEMLAAGVKVLIYAGDKDIICNYVGNRRWVDALQWERSAEWAEAQDEAWEVEGEKAGWVAQVGPLSFVRVADAGHMVPMDKPKVAYTMISSFIRGESLTAAPSVANAVASQPRHAGFKGDAAAALSLLSRKERAFRASAQ